MNNFKRTLSFVSLFLMGSCGGDGGASLTVSGDTNPSKSACTKYTVTRSKAASEALIVQPSVESGGGAVYSDDGCSTLALLNIEMASGASSANFSYKGSGVSGAVVIEVTTLGKSTQKKDASATLNLTTK